MSNIEKEINPGVSFLKREGIHSALQYTLESVQAAFFNIGVSAACLPQHWSLCSLPSSTLESVQPAFLNIGVFAACLPQHWSQCSLPSSTLESRACLPQHWSQYSLPSSTLESVQPAIINIGVSAVYLPQHWSLEPTFLNI